MTGNETRSAFLDYFKGHGHKVIKSASLVPRDDPTLLFTNAGMVPFKRTFLGEEVRDYVRATSAQKCVRAGGKHNDLENVGYTARHHTFFEMLGHFSFGDYFKEEAIALAWELLVGRFGLPEERLWISVYRDDDEAYGIWNVKMGVPEARIVRLGERDNFWSMGDTGPCGPCSEILIDRGEASGCGRPECRVGCECDRYLEIWNLVFMQFNRDASGAMEPLPKPSIDTGMGLERIVSVLQEVPSNYETDLFTPIIRKIEDLSGKKLGQRWDDDVSMRVIADHARAAAFLIGDGILPSNDGRGYVLRRIMRRAIRYGRQLGLKDAFLHEAAAIVLRIMEPAYPELMEARTFIGSVIANEEDRFTETLESGLKHLNESLSELRAKGQRRVPGDLLFKLYDTYGFPTDIVRDVLRDQDMDLDMDGFERQMALQRERSRSVAAFSETRQAFRGLTSLGLRPEFVGYTDLRAESQVLLAVHEDQEVPAAQEGDEVEVVTAVTPFYAEAGGQAGDTGRITGPGLEMTVARVVKDPTGLIIHGGKVLSGELRKGQSVLLEVDAEKRRTTALNHTATHLLHAALRKVLGNHVKQAGSLVGAERLRFDFTHFSPLSDRQVRDIENLVNERIRDNVPVHTAEMEAEKAFHTGAMALFEEKYGDRVRVVSVDTFSKELCGGTHTERTGDIGLFLILGEAGIASGVRRIEAVTGPRALAHVQGLSRLVHELAQRARSTPDDLVQRLEGFLSIQRQQEREIAALKGKMAAIESQASADEIRKIRGVAVMAKTVQAGSAAELREVADRFRDRIGSGVVVLGSRSGDRALLVAVVTKDLIDRYHAGHIVKRVAATVGGSGGGRADLAQAGGNDASRLEEALESVYGIVEGTG